MFSQLTFHQSTRQEEEDVHILDSNWNILMRTLLECLNQVRAARAVVVSEEWLVCMWSRSSFWLLALAALSPICHFQSGRSRRFIPRAARPMRALWPGRPSSEIEISWLEWPTRSHKTPNPFSSCVRCTEAFRVQETSCTWKITTDMRHVHVH